MALLKASDELLVLTQELIEEAVTTKESAFDAIILAQQEKIALVRKEQEQVMGQIKKVSNPGVIKSLEDDRMAMEKTRRKCETVIAETEGAKELFEP